MPFARGRVTYLDEPLEGNDKATFERYIKWLVKPSYVSVEQVFSFIANYVEEQKQEQKKKVFLPKPTKDKDVALGFLGKMKNRYRQTLVDFWTGKVTPADSLNTAIVLTERMLPFYFDDADDGPLISSKGLWTLFPTRVSVIAFRWATGRKSAA